MYFFIKTAHILFMIGWLSCVFVLPRVLLYWKMASESGKETDLAKLLSIKLSRFGLLMFAFACGFGVWLWSAWGINGNWFKVKLYLVALLFIYFIFSIWMMIRAIKYKKFLNKIVLHVFNELSLDNFLELYLFAQKHYLMTEYKGFNLFLYDELVRQGYFSKTIISDKVKALNGLVSSLYKKIK